MKLFEYQAKQLFNAYRIPTDKFVLCNSSEDVVHNYKTNFKSNKAVLKAQVLTGGRGKAGGVQLIYKDSDVDVISRTLFNLTIKGFPVRKAILTEAIDIEKEYYIAFVIDRNSKSTLFISSKSGGIDIEEVATTMPQLINKHLIDPFIGVPLYLARELAFELLDSKDQALALADIIQQMYAIMIDKDASLVEINPLVVDKAGRVLAIDGKIDIDNNSKFRHEDLFERYELSAAELLEEDAKSKGFSYIQLEGNIGCIVNGAGLAMATMDMVEHYGAKPANFLDIGGSSNPIKVENAIRMLLNDRKVQVIFINIFGGITRCDDVAKGVIEALKKIETTIPIVVRLTGTNAEEGLEILRQNENLIIEESMAKAALKAIQCLPK